MKNLFKAFFVLIVIFSLGLNIILLNDKKNNPGYCDNEEVDIKDTTKKEEKTKIVKLDKETFSKLFKDYQTEAKLAKSDDVAVWDVIKITEVGYFKSNENKRLYYVEERYSCVEGTDCISTVGKVDTNSEYVNTTTFVVAATPVDTTSSIFEILDYSIEKNEDFQKINPVELK